jgi:hypothetical protein
MDGAAGPVERGPELYGVNPGPPGFGPGSPIELPPGALVGCAQAADVIASAATTATPVSGCFMVVPSRSVDN